LTKIDKKIDGNFCLKKIIDKIDKKIDGNFCLKKKIDEN